MNILVKKITLTLALSVIAATALANPGQVRRGSEGVGANASQQQDVNDGNGLRANRNYQSPEPNQAAEEGLRKQSKLSPEERRALRRQINEAGQDLYIRKP